MSRTLRLVFSKQEGFKKSWNYPSSQEYCTRCGHHHCYDPIGVKGNKALKKGKGTHKEHLFVEDEVDDDG